MSSMVGQSRVTRQELSELNPRRSTPHPYGGCCICPSGPQANPQEKYVVVPSGPEFPSKVQVSGPNPAIAGLNSIPTGCTFHPGQLCHVILTIAGTLCPSLFSVCPIENFPPPTVTVAVVPMSVVGMPPIGVFEASRNQAWYWAGEPKPLCTM